jgi:hypothetical protein
MKVYFGICGTAFRKDDAKRCSKPIFDAMYIVADSLVKQCEESNYKIDTLISGGAAGADFVAVKLFLDKKVPRLKLFIPCRWNDGTFESKQEKDPGSTLNYYHKKFQLATRINSLSQMQIAKGEGAEFISVKQGFFARNYLIAKYSDFLLAMTFGKGSVVKSGGSSHTVKCYLDRVKKEGFFDKSFHYDLNKGEIYPGCIVSKEDANKQAVKKIFKNLSFPLPTNP